MVTDDAWQTPAEHTSAHMPAHPSVSAPPPVRPVRAADTLAGLAEELAHPAPEVEAPRPIHPEPLRAVPQHAASQHAASTPPAHAAPDQSLAEMAQRLEAALRRPMAQKVVADGGPRVAALAEVKSVREPKVVVAQPKGGAQPKPQQSANLEQEMATLLSRPGKT
jgi:hypothetical protein